MPYNSETETFYQAPATVVDSTPDGDTVQEGFDDRLTPALAGVYADFNLLKADGMISVGIPATTTARGIGRVATAEDAAVGSTITNGPAFLDAATWKVSATPAAGTIPLADASGTLASWVDPVSAVAGTFSNLKVSATGTNANVSCTADEVIVKNSSNKYLTLRGVSVSAAVSSSGAGGLDTGTIAANTWYYVHIIHNPTTSITTLLLSLSSTAPTLPSGYTYRARVGAIRTDATNKYPLRFTQAGRKVEYKPLSGSNLTSYPVMASGAMGTIDSTTYTGAAVSVSQFIPPTASAIRARAYAQSGSAAITSAQFGQGYSSANLPPYSNVVSGNFAYSTVCDLILESGNIYVAQSSGGITHCIGWEDNL